MAKKILDIYKKIFHEFNTQKVKYFVYKWVAHLEVDLNGDRWDIDIYIDESDIKKARGIILSCGFKDVSNSLYKDTFFAIDLTSNKTVMLDINTSIHLCRKPFLQHYWCVNIEYKKIKTILYQDLIKIIDTSDYLALQILFLYGSKNKSLDKINEIQSLIHTDIDTDTYWWKLLKNILKDKPDEVIWSITEYKEYKDQYYNNISTYKQKKNYFFREKVRNIKLLFKYVKTKVWFPSYRLHRKWFLVAFTWVDWSWKSSAVDMVMHSKFFKYTWVKKIYFWSNNYWIPGLSFLLKRTKNVPGRIILSIFVRIDRQFRIIWALYFILLWNIVIADRYYYDDMISLNPYNKNRLKYSLYNFYTSVFKVRMLKLPEVSFYMDVSPENAYKRKQDYDFTTMEKMNKLYSDLMKSRKEVTIIDANKDIMIVHTQIIQKIYNYK